MCTDYLIIVIIELFVNYHDNTSIIFIMYYNLYRKCRYSSYVLFCNTMANYENAVTHFYYLAQQKSVIRE